MTDPRAAEHAAFRRPILENLLDDLPQLVYADFLDETGDPANIATALYLRMYLAMKGMATVHPFDSVCDCERCRLRRELRSIRDSWPNQWPYGGEERVRTWI